MCSGHAERTLWQHAMHAEAAAPQWLRTSLRHHVTVIVDCALSNVVPPDGTHPHGTGFALKQSGGRRPVCQTPASSRQFRQVT